LFSKMSMSIAGLCVKNVIQADSQFNLITASEDDSVESVMELMKKNKISSLPIKKSVPRADNQIIGIIDLLDIVTYAYTKFAKVSLLAQESYEQMEQFNAKRVGDLLNISGRNYFHTIQYSKPLSDLLSLFTNPNIHRVSVINEQNDIVGFITQSKILRFLHSQQGKLDSSVTKLLQTKVKDCMPITLVVSVNMNCFMIEAYRLIWDNAVTGVAVVDDEGKLVGNVSASDLKRVHLIPVGELVHDLYQPIKNFLHIRTNVKEKVALANFPNPAPKLVTGDETIGKVLDIVMENNIHRVYIVDILGRTTGVISLRDIIARMLEASECK